MFIALHTITTTKTKKYHQHVNEKNQLMKWIDPIKHEVGWGDPQEQHNKLDFYKQKYNHFYFH